MGNPLLAVPETTPIPVLLNAKDLGNGVWALQVSDSNSSAVSAYALNDFADGNPLYLGKVKADGTWLLQRFNSSTGEMRYANLSNNSGTMGNKLNLASSGGIDYTTLAESVWEYVDRTLTTGSGLTLQQFIALKD